MNYDQLFAFVAFAEHGSFTRAARQLHISQPALHVQIRKLSEAVGLPLYRREGRALSLTPEGKHLAAYGREVAARGRAVLEELRGEAQTGPIVLAAGQGAFHYLLGAALRRFPKQRFPLRLLTLPGPEALAALRDARAHLAVVAAEHPPAGDAHPLGSVALRTVGQHVVVPTGHRLAGRRSLRVADLAAEPLVVAPAGSPHRAMLTQLLAAAGHQLQVAVEATGWELMLQFARYGIAATVVNDFCPAPPGTIAIPLPAAPRTTYYLLSRTALTNRCTQTLHELIVSTTREQPRA
jgi:LysR family transcriptional regulator, low CO2-responsive transcriptional regulator